jgi:outer membrane receptor protein involved in Fe transport
MTRGSIGHHRLFCSASLAAILALTGVPAHAQAPAGEKPAAEEQAEPGVNDIVVTASRIQRSGFTAPTPTTIIGAAAIENRGATNLGTVLNETPQFKATVNPATTAPRAIFPGSYYADLRGLGVSRTLVLVNRNRFVPQITTGLANYAVDMNQVPTLLLDRVEIVTGGASAQWGSDAVAGVVNLILKRNYEGLEATAQYGQAEVGDYKEYRAGLLYGAKLGDRTHIEVAGDYVRNKGVRDVYTRDWGRRAFGLVTNPCRVATPPATANCAAGDSALAANLILPDARYSTSTNGGLIYNTTGAASQLRGIFINPDGSIGRFQYGSYVGTQFMQGGGSNAGLNFNTGVDVIPPMERVLGYGRITHELDDDFEIYAEASYASSIGHNQTLPPRNDASAGSPIVINVAQNPFIPTALRTEINRLNALPANAANQITSFNLGENIVGLGNQYSTVKNITYRGVAGFSGKLGTWKIEGALTYGKNRYLQAVDNDRIISRFNFAVDAIIDPSTSQAACRALVVGSTTYNPTAAAGCVPINLFGGSQISAAAKNYVTGTLTSSTIYEQTAANLSLSGDAFSLWAGPVSVAVGLEYRNEKQVTVVDPIAEVAGYESTNARSLRGSFNAKEIFGEVAVPLAKDWIFARSLEVTGAVRFTDYSTSGSVTTWKVGGTWVPIPGLLVRGAHSRDIRAPNLFELYTAPISTTLNRVFNASVLGGPTGSVATENLSGGNSGLAPEKSKTTTIGFSYSPPFVPGLQFSVDHYDITVSGAIAAPDVNLIINYCTGTTPTTAEQQAFYCSLISRQPAGSPSFYRVVNNFQNINATQRMGWDFEASYRLQLSRISASAAGALTLRFSGNYIQHYRDNLNASGFVERSGEISGAGTPKWLTNSSITYDNKLWTLGLQMRTVGKGKYSNTFVEGVNINDNTIEGRTYFNLSASVRPLKGLEIFGVINNLTDLDPVLAPQSFGFPFVPAWHDPIGRAFRIGVRYKM